MLENPKPSGWLMLITSMGDCWHSLSGLRTILGIAAPFTFGFQSVRSHDRTPVWYVVTAIGLVVLGVVLWALVRIIADSRSDDADTVGSRARKERNRWYAIIGFLMLGQVVVFLGAAGFEAAAIFHLATNVDADLKAELKNRINLYIASTTDIKAVTGYCDKHVSDDSAGDRFLHVCAQFSLTPTPTTGASERLYRSAKWPKGSEVKGVACWRIALCAGKPVLAGGEEHDGGAIEAPATGPL